MSTPPPLFKSLKVIVLLLVLSVALAGGLSWYQAARAADGDLQVSIVAGYNLVVDSNVTSPSTYSPSVATVIGKFCNTSTTTLPNVVGSIGDYVDGTVANDVPGVYPVRVANAAFAIQHSWQSNTSGSIAYSFTHLGGTADASRYIGDIPAGQCKVQYWSFTYPRCEDNGAIPCSLDPVWGASSNPNDDLWLEFDVWGRSTTSAGSVVDVDDATWRMTMRNEISAMANKIEPNPDGHWFTTDTTVVEAGEVITSNGVLYTFGNVNKGFDNDGDLQFDYNAWMQPFGDPSYDPSCFRLIRTTGTVTVTRGGGPDQIFNFTDNLYFTNLPADNTNVTGVVRYTFLALGGTCTTAMTPYQEAASGADNEKFNGDFGAGIPPIKSYAPEIVVDKNGTASQSEGGTVSYSIPFRNDGNSSAGLTFSSGFGVEMPFTIQDSVPAGLQYSCNSATLALGYTPATLPGYRILYSNDGGETWRDNQSVLGCPTNPLSTAANPIVIRWQLTEPFPAKPGSGANTSYGTAAFNAIIPVNYISGGGEAVIVNTACANLGGATLSLDCGSITTLVRGNNSIGDFVWSDTDGDGVQDTGEPGLNGVTVKLYWDRNANGVVDTNDLQLNAANVNVIDGALDLDGNGSANDNGELDGYDILNGLVDVNDDGLISAADTGTALIGGYNVIAGYLDLDANASISNADDGRVAGTTSASKSATITNGVLSGFSGTSFAGYTIIGGLVDVNGDGLINTSDNSTALVGGYNIVNGYVGSNTTNGTLNGIYGFAYLPNKNYIVQVTASDNDVTTGYAPSTQTRYAVNLTAGNTNNRTSDFGFGPALVIDKHTSTGATAYNEGDLVTFHIDLTNKLPGNGTASGLCQYTLWSSTAGTHSSGTGWQNTGGVLGINGPDNVYTFINPANNVDVISAGGFGLGTKPGSITKVEVLYSLYIDTAFVDDVLIPVYWNAAAGTQRSATAIPVATINAYGPGASMQALYAWDVTSLETSWIFTDFNSANLQVGFSAQRGGGGASGDTTLRLDAAGFRITTDQVCGGADTTIAELPLTDTYDAARLQFVSATPPQTTQSAGTINWSNLGPLYAGATKEITVVFRALDPAGNTASTTNTAAVAASTAKYGNGRYTNGASDGATVTIAGLGSITGKVFSDRNTIGWVGTNGYEALGTLDYAIAGATVTLYGCYNAGVLVTDADNQAGRTCAGQGAWQAVPGKATTTDANGDYRFDYLALGYYYVQVSLPAWAGGATQSAEATQAGAGATCAGNCNSIWEPGGPAGSYATAALNTTNFNPIGTTGAGTNTDPLTTPYERITNVNFGYSNVPARIYGNIYTDSNGDGSQSSAEGNLSGVTVRLCTTADCSGGGNPVATTTTASDGSYSFNGVTPGSYYVVVTQPANTTQTDDPDNAGACSTNGGCDNRSNPITVVAGQSAGPYTFGYRPTGSYAIGDSVYRDWDGDGVRDAGEENLPNITVWLYEDEDNDGVIDPEDALIASNVTDANGYSFPNLPNANYIVVVDTSDTDFPAGHAQSGDPDEGSPCTTCDSKSTSAAIAGADDNGNDFGYKPTGYGFIGDRVWVDRNQSGTQDAGEVGRGGVTVNLYHDTDGDGIIDSEDALLGTTTTLAYAIIDGYIDLSGNGSIGAEDAGTLYGKTITAGAIDLNGSGAVSTADDGAFVGYVVVDGRLDVNASGAADTNDGGSLLGYYQFSNLPTNNVSYIVDIDNAEQNSGGDLYGYTLTNDTGAGVYSATQLSRKVSLTAAVQTVTDADFGFAPPGRIGNLVWQDNNANGLQDTNEPGLAGVTVRLYSFTYTDSNSNGSWDEGEPRTLTQFGSDATTNASGIYEFTNLPPNNYAVEVISGIAAGSIQTYDPDAPVSYIGCGTGTTCNPTGSTYLSAGQTNHSMDFGYRPLGRIGDTLWVDLNSDGVRQDTEPGIGGASVYLCDSAIDTPPCTGANANYATVTDSNGNYAFGGIPDGNWFVSVPTLANYSQTYEANDTTPDGTTEVVLSGGDVTQVGGTPCTGCSMALDFGYRYNLSGAYTLSGTIFYDASGNGGAYTPGTDTPYPGITVYLYDATSGALIATTTTVTNTNTYQFSGLPAGNYRVAFNKSGQLNLLSITTEPDDALCTDAASTCNNWAPVSVSANTSNVDFGLYATMDCGDLPSTYNVSAYQYGTQLAANGPCHVHTSDRNIDLNPSEHGMASIDYESDGQPNGTASGDGSDEDGVMRAPYELWTPNSTVHIMATVAGNNAYLAAWFDWNADGDFADSGEYRYYGYLAEGTHTLPLVLPSNCCTGAGNTILNVRFRLYQGFSPPAVIAPTGMVVDGEVEDYQWVFSPTAVKVESFHAYPGRTATGFVTIAALFLLLTTLLLGSRNRPRLGFARRRA